MDIVERVARALLRDDLKRTHSSCVLATLEKIIDEGWAGRIAAARAAIAEIFKERDSYYGDACVGRLKYIIPKSEIDEALSYEQKP